MTEKSKKPVDKITRNPQKLKKAIGSKKANFAWT